jgi:hypothetical protein
VSAGTAGHAKCGWKQPRCVETYKRQSFSSIGYSAATERRRSAARSLRPRVAIDARPKTRAHEDPGTGLAYAASDPKIGG